eukprot:CAMPEP_0179309300 /NCGR_PEP_ID=MMETSP0797-20121207/51586_1 /TAXON_ID=47934 /ORGANISM="Dinophysis acuminata, Strain DAEP01" /LENGTH=397 /DNA_ID=CAMNT_0021019011 /DNA_START=155 /DNA_END=1348 /DNA_ORIENTATION=-
MESPDAKAGARDDSDDDNVSWLSLGSEVESSRKVFMDALVQTQAAVHEFDSEASTVVEGGRVFGQAQDRPGTAEPKQRDYSCAIRHVQEKLDTLISLHVGKNFVAPPVKLGIHEEPATRGELGCRELLEERLGAIEGRQLDLGRRLDDFQGYLRNLFERTSAVEISVAEETYTNQKLRENVADIVEQQHHEQLSIVEARIRKTMEEQQAAMHQKLDDLMALESRTSSATIREFQELDAKVRVAVGRCLDDMHYGARTHCEQASAVEDGLQRCAHAISTVRENTVVKMLQSRTTSCEDHSLGFSKISSDIQMDLDRCNIGTEHQVAAHQRFANSLGPQADPQDRLGRVEQRQCTHGKRLDDIQGYLRRHYAAEASLWKLLDQTLNGLLEQQQAAKTAN